MTLLKKLLLLAAFAALATAALGGTAPIALGHDEPPAAHPTCTWSVDKTASLHSSPGVPITTLNLSLDQTVTVAYKIVVTRNCEEGFDPGAHGAGANVVDSHAGTLAWNLVPGGAGADTVFFLSGASWYQVFWTAPAGNAYYNLAHQYMAARLNVLDGASAPSSVTDAIASATTLFQTYTPAQ